MYSKASNFSFLSNNHCKNKYQKGLEKLFLFIDMMFGMNLMSSKYGKNGHNKYFEMGSGHSSIHFFSSWPFDGKNKVLKSPGGMKSP